MKKLLLSFSLFLFLLTQTKAQTSVYHPFPDSNAVWNQGLGISEGCGGPYRDFSEFYSFVFDGDTAINTNQYHKLYRPFIDTPYCGLYAQSTGYMAGIRQNILNRKVYIVPP